MIRISDILPADELAAMQAQLSGNTCFADGAATAGWHARLVKKNEQLTPQAAAPVIAKLESALLKHPVFQAAARPAKIVRMLVSRYQPGMEYGLHVDDAIMGGERTDLSFTYFLSAPESYEGGALVLADAYAERDVKLPAGELFLYPSGSLHKVEPLTRGERLAVVGWVRSHVRDAGAREVLFDLDNAIAEVFARDGKSALFDVLVKTRTNLMRRWAA